MGLVRFFRRRYWDEERARELEAHLEHETDENVARGMSPEEARYAARRKLGNRTRIREEIYAMNSAGLVDTLWQDLRYGIRQLAGDRGFTSVAVLTLGLGIGSVTVMYSVIHNVLLDPFPYAASGRMVDVMVRDLDQPESVLPRGAPAGRVPRLPGAEPGVRRRDRNEHRADGAAHAGARGAGEHRPGHAQHVCVPRCRAAPRTDLRRDGRSSSRPARRGAEPRRLAAPVRRRCLRRRSHDRSERRALLGDRRDAAALHLARRRGLGAEDARARRRGTRPRTSAGSRHTCGRASRKSRRRPSCR